ncbi:hypothetical protein [Streptomyces venezuelae]|uniref:hypothetical protein n=1 Tax=Streptomyces venezuelae TaxID=54571 RepID=UPI003420E9A1
MVIVLADLSATWNTFVSWIIGVFTPRSAVKLPRVALAPETDETRQAVLPGQFVRL